MVRTKQDAQEDLRHYNRELAQCVVEAWSQLGQDAAALNPVMSTRSQSSLMHDLVVHHIRKRFDGRPGINLTTHRNLFLMSVGGEWLIKIKKLRKGTLRASNVPTIQAQAFVEQMQLQLDGMPPVPTNLHLGYTLSPARSAIEGVYLVCPDGSRLHWRWQLLRWDDIGPAGQIVPMPSRPSGDAPAAPRVRPKPLAGEEAVRGEGTAQTDESSHR